MARPTWKEQARRLKQELSALWLAYRDPRLPWHARLLIALVVGYAFSPIDLIPDFIPVLGHLDDLILIPLGVALALRSIPPEVLAECRERAARAAVEGGGRPAHWAGALLVVAVWALVAGLLVAGVLR